MTVLDALQLPKQPFNCWWTWSIWSVHENLFLRRSQIRFSFLIRLEVAQQRLDSPP